VEGQERAEGGAFRDDQGLRVSEGVPSAGQNWETKDRASGDSVLEMDHKEELRGGGSLLVVLLEPIPLGSSSGPFI